MIPLCVPMGDGCLSVTFDEKIDPAVNARCVALATELERRAIPGVRDIVPAYHAVAVFFDPRRVERRALQWELEALAALEMTTVASEPAPIEISVSYGGEAGPMGQGQRRKLHPSP